MDSTVFGSLSQLCSNPAFDRWYNFFLDGLLNHLIDIGIFRFKSSFKNTNDSIQMVLKSDFKNAQFFPTIESKRPVTLHTLDLFRKIIVDFKGPLRV